MGNLDNNAISATAITANPKQLLAAPRHTLTLFGILAILVVAGVMNSSKTITASDAADSARMIKTDLIMIGMLWLWVLFVFRGMREYRRSILEFFDFKSVTPAKLIGDCAGAALAFAVIYACSFGVHHLLPSHASSNPILSSEPQGVLGIVVWLCLSISAGISEEIVFRGYLQRQLSSMTGKVAVAILVQAAVFGIGHAYEGFASVVAIVLHGLFLGILAQWRGNIRAGIIEHAGWDILAGFGLIGASW
jgi:membrane protease YdiL (CAAX protease family)